MYTSCTVAGSQSALSSRRLLQVGLYTLLHVLRVLFASVIRLSVDEQKQLQQDLVLLVTRFAVPPELISTAIDIATVVSDIEATEPGEGGQVNRNTEAFHKRYQTLVDDWAVEIIKVMKHPRCKKAFFACFTLLQKMREVSFYFFGRQIEEDLPRSS